MKKGKEARRVPEWAWPSLAISSALDAASVKGTPCLSNKPGRISCSWLFSTDQPLSSDNCTYLALSKGTRSGSDLQTRDVIPHTTVHSIFLTHNPENSHTDYIALLTSISVTLQRISFFLIKNLLLKLQEEHASFQNGSFT